MFSLAWETGHIMYFRKYTFLGFFVQIYFSLVIILTKSSMNRIELLLISPDTFAA